MSNQDKREDVFQATVNATYEIIDEPKEYRQLLKQIVKLDPQCRKVQFSSTKINNFALQMTEYVSKSIITMNMETRLDEIRHLIASIFKLDFINYYLDKSESEISLLDKYIQLPVQKMSFEEEIERYSLHRGSAGIGIGKINEKIASAPIWSEIMKDSLEKCVASKQPKYNFIATFGSIPDRNIECALIISTEYLSEWLSESSPAPINGIPLVVIWDSVSLFGSVYVDPEDYQDELSIAISVGGDLSRVSGMLTCFLKETTTNDIFALTAAHAAFKSAKVPSKIIISPSQSLLQPGNSDRSSNELNDEQNKRRPIASYFVHKFGGDLIDGFSVDACLYKLNDNRPMKTPYNSFVTEIRRFKEVLNKTCLTGIGDIDKYDDESKYFISRQSNRWNFAYIANYPYQALIDNKTFNGEMYFSNRNPFVSQLCLRGYSGAPVINKQSQLVGMLYGGSVRTGIAMVTPIKAIIKAFKPLNLELCLSQVVPC